MLENPGEIQNIYSDDNEYYFRYRGHAFSCARSSVPGRLAYIFYVYPNIDSSLSTKDIADIFRHDYDAIKMASFRDTDYTDVPIAKLFDVIELEFLGVDKIFDDILKSEHRR